MPMTNYENLNPYLEGLWRGLFDQGINPTPLFSESEIESPNIVPVDPYIAQRIRENIKKAVSAPQEPSERRWLNLWATQPRQMNIIPTQRFFRPQLPIPQLSVTWPSETRFLRPTPILPEVTSPVETPPKKEEIKPKEKETEPKEKPVEFPRIMFERPTDYEAELMKIFEETIPKWEELPKPREDKPPSTPSEFLYDFARNLALLYLKKDPFEYRRLLKAEEEAKTQQERQYILQRASNLLNLRIQALNEKMRREEENRRAGIEWLTALANSNPDIMNNKNFQLAVASYAGVPPSEVESFLKQFEDPETGQLKNFYKDPQLRQIELQKKMTDLHVDMLKEMGFSDDEAKIMVLSKESDPAKIALTLYFKYNRLGQTDKAKEQLEKYNWIRQQNLESPEMERAANFINKYASDKEFRNTVNKIFGEHTDQFIKHQMATALGAKGFKPEHAPKASEEISRKRLELLNEAIKAVEDERSGKKGAIQSFIDKWKIDPINVIHAIGLNIKSGSLDENVVNELPSDIKYALKIEEAFKKKTGKADTFLTLSDSSSPARSAARSLLRKKYNEQISEIEKTIKSKAPKKFRDMVLTDDEVVELADALESNDTDKIINTYITIFNRRGLKLK